MFARVLTLHDRLLEKLPRRWFFEAEAKLHGEIATLSPSGKT
ncbi:hypothetical protein [Paraburkholderia adhaesiva]|nr:hypothetical protein [Paraburkholderia adhaesiva]